MCTHIYSLSLKKGAVKSHRNTKVSLNKMHISIKCIDLKHIDPNLACNWSRWTL